jgi:hypothetical protein
LYITLCISLFCRLTKNHMKKLWMCIFLEIVSMGANNIPAAISEKTWEFSHIFL